MTREDVLQLHTLFEYFDPEDGILRIQNLPNNKYTRQLRELFTDFEVVSFDDFYRIMKEKQVLGRQSMDFDTVKYENNSARVSCLLWPSTEEDGPDALEI